MWSGDFEIYESFEYGTRVIKPPDEKGLTNNFGENNCFLNVVIQALWHLDSFRNKFVSHKMKTGHRHGENCVYCALEVIFLQYEFSDESRLPPTALRETMAVLFKDVSRFQLFEVDDAAEALEAVLDRLHGQFRPDQSPLESDDNIFCNDPDCIAHKVFGLNLAEQIQCNKCGASTQPFKSTMFTAYTYAASLRNASLRDSSVDATFCQLINKANSDIRYCPNKEKCNNLCKVSRQLTRLPEVFSVGVVWDSPTPSMDDIGMTLKMISQRIDLNNIFPSPNRVTPCHYRLRGMIAYYGKHYIIFMYNLRKREWFVYDDVTVKPVGATWPEVQFRCVRGHLQPSVLLYEIEDLEQTNEIPHSLPEATLGDQSLPDLIEQHQIQQIIQEQQQQIIVPPETSSEKIEESVKKSQENFVEKELSSGNPDIVKISKIKQEVVEQTLALQANDIVDDVECDNKVNLVGSVIDQRHDDVIPPNNDVTPPNNNDIVTTKKEGIEDNFADLLSTPDRPEDSFIFVNQGKEDSPVEELDFTVIRTNWLYRRQVRRFRFKSHCFVRIVPGTGEAKESFDYKDVFDVTITDPRNMIIRFYSGKEPQYIESERNYEIVDILTTRSKAIGHKFAVKRN